MSNRLLFVAGDVGGARALHPVITLAAMRGHTVLMLQHGHIASMPPIAGAQRLLLDRDSGIDEAAARLIAETKPDVLVYATSVKDETALRVAHAARSAGIALAHLLDNWASYRRRLELEGQFLLPDLYAVMDDVARDEAEAAGIAVETIRVTGTPALSDLTPCRRPMAAALPLRLVFVSEPVSMDQGDDPARPQYRGYIETTVLALLAEAMADKAASTRIDILPHPREDAAQLDRNWQALRGNLAGGLVTAAGRDAAIEESHGIVGMSSILLYASWLRGWPVASLQPGLRLPELRMLAGRPGVMFIDDATSAPSSLRGWRDSISTYQPPAETAMEITRHLHAAETFLTEVVELAETHRPGTSV